MTKNASATGTYVNPMTTAALKYTTRQIVNSLMIIGGGRVSTDLTLVRAALLKAYEIREGEEAADRLLDKLGM